MHATNAGKITLPTSFITNEHSTATSGEYPETATVAPSDDNSVNSTGKIAFAKVVRAFIVSLTVFIMPTIPLISTITIAE